MAEYICPQDIQDHYKEDPGEARMMLAEWLLNLDLKVGDRIWEPEEGWHEKTAETKWQ